MSKKYQLMTVQDIIETVNEQNKENFLKDFSKWIEIVVNLKKQTKKLILTKFEWIDDDKEDYQINLKEIKEESTD